MKRAVVISFFSSKNLGDLALSNTLENLLKDKNYSIKKYDFLTLDRISEATKEKVFSKSINDNEQISTIEKIFYKNIKMNIKKIIVSILGELNTAVIKYKIGKIVDKRKWNKLESDVINSDIIVIGGGNMIMDINPIWADLFNDYVKLFSKHNKKINVVYVGVGPIIYERSKKLYNDSFKKVNKISVRDKISKEICELIIDRKDIIQSVDPVFLLPIDSLNYRINKIKINNPKYKIGISILGQMCFDNEKSHKIYLENLYELFISIMKKSNIIKEIILFSTEVGDYRAINKFYNMIDLNDKNLVKIKKIKKINDINKLYEELDFLIGGRMHGLIFAQKCLLPFIGIVWQNKINGFADATNNLGRIFEVEDIKRDKDIIVEQIFKDARSKELIEKMNNSNKILQKIAIKGMTI